jgi:starch phosphorylase
MRGFHEDFRRIKFNNKSRLTEYIKLLTDVVVSLETMFDVQIKRIHEYKRQLLNCPATLSIFTRR